MSIIYENVDKFTKKVCKIVSKRLSRLSHKKTKNKKTDSIVSCNISHKALSKGLIENSLFVKQRTNRLYITCTNGVDDYKAKIYTTYCCFVSSPFVKTNTSFIFCEETSYSQRLVIQFVPLTMSQKIKCDNDVVQNTCRNKDILEKLSKYDLCVLPNANVMNAKTYKKFIPLFLNTNSKMYPRGNIDYEAPMCWLDIQGWYTLYQEEKYDAESELRVTKSDTSTNDSNTLISCISSGTCTSHHKDEFCEFCSRFTYPYLEKYLSIAASRYNSRKCEIPLELYIELTGSQTTAMNLIKLKTELLVKCFESFFFPYGESMVAWVPSLLKQVQEADIEDFRQRNYRVMLKLSEPTSILLRHREISLLDTICKIIGIHKSEIKLYLYDIPGPVH